MSISSFLKLALCAGSFVQSVYSQSSNWTVGQVVKSSSGPVTGHAASVNKGVSVYLGIPFAVPPTGDLRWTAPKSYNGTAALNGTDYGFSCPMGIQADPSAAKLQSLNLTTPGLVFLASLGQYGDKFSEDCLTLNVWTKPQVGEKKKAVLVWIYGGGFTTGNSDNAGYDGQYIVEQEDVILVSFNYRLDLFGFPGTPGATQNLGILDQRLAIEWVRNNIAAFGGDTSRITLFGQSAGSASVDYHTFAYAKDPIAHGFIEESGSALGPAPGLGPLTADAAAAYWFNLTSTVGCGDNSTDAAQVLSCMKGKPYQELLEGALPGEAGGISPIPSSFGPTVDGVICFSDYPARAAAGNFAKKPLLLGTANYEAGLFKVLDAFKNVTQSDTYWNDFDDVVFVCPCAARANASISAGIPTWRYRWFGAFYNNGLTTVPWSGAYHASELSVLFDTAQLVANNTAAEAAIGSYFRGAWATFAKNPTTGLTTYQDGWPEYSPTKNTLVQLAFNNQTGTNLAIGNSFDGTCSEVVADVASNSTTNSTTPSSSVSGSSTPSPTTTIVGETPFTGGSEPASVLSVTMLALTVAVAIDLAL